MTKPTMLDYVQETPAVVRKQLTSGFEQELVNAFLQGSYSRIRIVACGSSRNASLIARPFLRAITGCEVLVTEPYTFCTYEHELRDDEFVFVVSQSGYSTNALAALAVIKAAGKTAIGITGDPTSDFKDAADMCVTYGVGDEQVGYVTKGVSSFASFLMLFGLGVALREARITKSDHSNYKTAIDTMLAQFEAAIPQTRELLSARYKELSNMERVFFAGAGTNYGIASEGALKFAECLQIPAQALELEEYLHGPNLQLSPAYSVFFIAVGEKSWARTAELIEATRLVTDHIFVVSDNPELGSGASQAPNIVLAPLELEQDKSKTFKDNCELIAPVAALPLFQILAYQLTEDKHLWHKHPLVAAFDAKLSGKSENYVDKEVL